MLRKNINSIVIDVATLGVTLRQTLRPMEGRPVANVKMTNSLRAKSQSEIPKRLTKCWTDIFCELF